LKISTDSTGEWLSFQAAVMLLQRWSTKLLATSPWCWN